MKFTLRSFITCAIISISCSDAYSVVCSDESIVRQHPFVLHSVWPAIADDVTKRCDNSLLRPDILELSNTLVRTLKTAYRPSPSDNNKLVAVTNYMEQWEGLPDFIRANDYIMVKYKSKTDESVMIQDGWYLYLLVTNQDCYVGREVRIDCLIPTVASRVFNYPLDHSSYPALSLSVVDESERFKVGYIDCGYVHDKAFMGENWYEHIAWWSDGLKVLFQVPKWTRADYLEWKSRFSEGLTRKFAYRGKWAARVVDDVENCSRNLNLILACKGCWQYEGIYPRAAGTPVDVDVINSYLLPRPYQPHCPSGGVYNYNRLGVPPVCSFSYTNSAGIVTRHSVLGKRFHPGVPMLTDVAALRGETLQETSNVVSLVWANTETRSSIDVAESREDPSIVCARNLICIENAKELWARNSRKAQGTVLSEDDVIVMCQYLRNGKIPKCPLGGEIRINAIGVAATCSIPDHRIE